nr:HNH endonuclease [Acidimicrobiia bacterium]
MLGEWVETSPGGVSVSPTRGLEAVEAGPLLAWRLARVDRRELNGNQLVELMRARSRLVSHLQAELLADVAELAHTPPGSAGSPPERTGGVDEFVSDEVAAALTLTSRSADSLVKLALDLERLPQVLAALQAGRIDVPRARVLCEETALLDDTEAAAVIDQILSEAEQLTTAQLGRRVRRLVTEIDPEAARRRLEHGQKERRIETASNPDGTADLVGRHLPPDRAAEAWSRIKAIARHLKRNGDERTLDQIRADVFLALLAGEATYPTHTSGGVRLTIDLPTLMGLTERAGDLEDWGPVVSDLARQIADALHGSPWEASVTDPATGLPIWVGTTRRRPTTTQRRWIEATNPACVFPGCSRPATKCHLDHTVPVSRNGKTTILNLGPLCARHHLRAKHKAGWKLAQPQPGTFCWTSPRSHQYEVRPRPP